MPVSANLDQHTPVLLKEIVGALSPHDGAVYVDATFGAGGYSKAILNSANCTVWGIDRDPFAIERSIDLQRSFKGRLAVLKGSFGNMVGLLSKVGIKKIDGVALDLGVSSMQINNAERGFSFKSDGPLDMRMAQSGITAAEVVNKLSEQELSDIIYRYGEERLSKRIAKAIVKSRSEFPITRTSQLAGLIRRVVKMPNDGKDPATRTFQALRIYVNDELAELDRGLRAAEILLRPGGRLCVVSFHSLEDRQVKEFFKCSAMGKPHPSRHMPAHSIPKIKPIFKILSKRVIKPKDEEAFKNPRARSARMRAAERTLEPPRKLA